MTDHFEWYRNALKGIVGDIPRGKVMDGYYRMQRRDGTWVPVGIWHDGDKQIARLGFGADKREITNPDEEWAAERYSWFSKNVVPFAAYQAACEGKPWHDSAPEPTLPSNLPSDPFERIKVEIQAEAEVVARHLAKPLDDTSAAQITGILDRIRRLGKSADAMRIEAKRPHDDAAAAVQRKFRPLIDGADRMESDLKRAAKAFIDAKRAAAFAAEVERQAKARKEREEAEWKAAERGEDPPPPPVEAPPPKIETAIRGVEGRTIAMRTRKVAKILDYDKALMALKDHPDVRALVQKICDQQARNKTPVAGTEIANEESVA